MAQPLSLDLEEGDESAHLILDRIEPDQRIELGLELVEASWLRRRPAGVEPVEPFDIGARSLLHALAQQVESLDEDVEGARHARQLPAASSV
jgi:hypothetical protein